MTAIPNHREHRTDDVSDERALLYEAAMACSPDGQIVLDAGGRIALINPAAEHMLGVEPQTTPGKTLRDAGRGLASVGEALARGETLRRVPHVLSHADGTVLAVEVDATPMVGAGALVTLRTMLEASPASFEGNLQRFLDTVLTPVVIHYEGRVEYANPTALATIGYEAQEVVGHDIWEFVAPEEREVLGERLRAVTQGTPGPIREDRFLARDGRVVVVEAISVPLLYHGRKCIASLGRDVTEAQKSRLERERLLSEIDAQRQLFKAIFEEVPAGIAILDATTLAIELANPAFRAFSAGYSVDGKKLSDGLVDIDVVRPYLDRVLSTGKPEHVSSLPMRVKRAPNVIETAYFTFSVARVRSPLGEHLAIVGMAVETTEEVRANRRAAELADIASRRAAELQGIIETMGDAVFVSDVNGILTMVNRAGLSLLGVDSLDAARTILEERPILSHVRSEDGEATPQSASPLARALLGENVSLEPETIVARGGRETFVRANARPIRAAESVVGAVEVMTDVSPLVEFDRLKDQFIRVAAHELKTPVTVMKGYAQSLLRSAKCDPAKLEAIDRGADRMDRTVRKLLDLSQLHLGGPRLAIADVNLAVVIEKAIARVRSNRHRIAVKSESSTIVRADEERVRFVVGGLLDNAVRYSPNGGDIEITMNDDGAEIVTTVRDHGIGIPRERQALVFQRFYRAHTDTPYDYGGMGVDLFLCREMIKRMGGRMWFESEDGNGSAFHFSLPRAGT